MPNHYYGLSREGKVFTDVCLSFYSEGSELITHDALGHWYSPRYQSWVIVTCDVSLVNRQTNETETHNFRPFLWQATINFQSNARQKNSSDVFRQIFLLC